MTSENDKGAEDREKDPFVRRLFVLAGVVLLLLLFIFILRETVAVLLVAFAGILLAIFLKHLSSSVQRLIKLPYTICFVVVISLISGLVALAIGVLEPRIAAQVSQLQSELPGLESEFQTLISRHDWLRHVASAVGAESRETLRLVGGEVPDIFTTTIGMIGGLAAAFFIGFYIALNSKPYVQGVLFLVPKQGQQRAEDVIHHVAYVLWRWILGRMIGMAFVGVFTGVGLYVLGVPLAITLGVLAALLDFVPNLGPIISAIPAMVFAFIEDPWLAVYVAILYYVIQFIEGNVLVPLIEERAVFVPPALTLMVQLMMYFMFGLLGVLLAIPVFAAVAESVKMLYVKDTLHKPVDITEEKA